MSVEASIDEGRIKQQVSRILETKSFRRSNILSKFLYYVVSETLNGNKKSLKEYVIAINVLKRSPDFDPQLDAIVRIHARRLRNLIDNYYNEAGLNDPIRISIPKGRYIPVFTDNGKQATVKINGTKFDDDRIFSKPVVAVLPFQNILDYEPAQIICTVLCHDISTELTRFEEINVVSTYSSQSAFEKIRGIGDLDPQLHIDYLITGNCMSDGDQVKITVELHSVQKKQIVWAESFYFEDFVKSKLHNYRTLIRKLMAMVGGFMGLLYRDSLNTKVPQDYDTVYAIYWHNKFHKHFSEEAFKEALSAVNIGLAKNPESSLLTAFKAELYLNLRAMDVQGEIDFHQEGLKLISKAIDLDQNNQHAWQVNAWANMLEHDKKQFQRSLERCLAINSNNAMYMGAGGFGYECMGEYEKGLELMSESISLNPYYPWEMNLGFCFYYLYHKEYDEAYQWAERINRRALVWDPLLRASALGHLGRKEEANYVLDEIFNLSPNFPERARIIIGAFILDEELKSNIIDGLIHAGIELAD